MGKKMPAGNVLATHDLHFHMGMEVHASHYIYVITLHILRTIFEKLLKRKFAKGVEIDF